MIENVHNDLMNPQDQALKINLSVASPQSTCTLPDALSKLDPVWQHSKSPAPGTRIADNKQHL